MSVSSAARDPAALAALRAKIRAIERRDGRGVGVSRDAGQPLSDGPVFSLQRGALHEVRAAAFFDEPAAGGFLLALAAQTMRRNAGALVWVMRRGNAPFGAPYGPGLAGFGIDPKRCLFVTPRKRAFVLAAAEEAVRTPGIASVIAEPGAAIDLTGARRLQLGAEAGGGSLLLRPPADAPPVLSARTRWRAGALPSVVPDWGLRRPAGAPAPLGAPRWRVALERGGAGPQTIFDLEWRHETGELCVAPGFRDGQGEAMRARA